MSEQFQLFYPGKYLEWEKKMVEERMEIAAKGPPKGAKVWGESPYENDFLRFFNRTWDPYNPLFNDKAYAQKAGYPDVPAFPGFKRVIGSYLIEIPNDIADSWIFGHGPDDIEFFTCIFPGDTLKSEYEKLMFEDITVPGSNLRKFKSGATMKTYNQKGDLVCRSTTWIRAGYRKLLDKTQRVTFIDAVEPTPPAHFTTDEEWEYIKQLWSKEYIRGKDILYWEDVKIGDEPAWTCSGPISYCEMARCEGYRLENPRDRIMKNDISSLVGLYKDRFGQYLIGSAQWFGGLNIPGARAIFFNHTGARHATRTVTNYIGDKGFVTRLGWMFEQGFQEMQYPREGSEYLDKVPYMKGKSCSVHGTEGDTIIGKGYVTDKYINDKKEHLIDLVCWCETLDNRIIQVVPITARLPSKQQ